jgi:mycothione reductase
VTAKEYDLVIVGAGSGNMLPTDEMADWRIAIVESDRFGGTCLNRGCIPSKIFVHTADVATTIGDAGRFGVDAELAGIDWPAIRDRVFARIDPVHDRAVEYRRRSGVDVYLGQARFVGPRTVDVDGTRLQGARIVLAVGSRPSVPPIPGIDAGFVHTSDTIMRLERLPESMLVIGGGFIAAEMSHVFGSLGTRITIVNRSSTLLGGLDHDLRDRFTRGYRERFDVELDAHVERIDAVGGRARAVLRRVDGSLRTVDAEVVLVATGRVPNSDVLDVAAAGIEVDDHGHVVTDAHSRTNVDGVWALGDLANHFQLKHMANAEMRIVRDDLLRPDAPPPTGFTVVPAAVFADPQVATVGATEEQLRTTGRPYEASMREYSATAYGWALEDTTGFVKVLADPETGLLLGAHALGPEASILIQPLIQAMCLGNTVTQIATEVLYIHPALTEVVEQALLGLDGVRD